MIVLILWLSLTQTLSYDNSSFTLGSNLISNPLFALPDIGSQDWRYVQTVPGWSCNPGCQIANLTSGCASNGKNCENNYTKALDLDSDMSFDEIKQNVSITVRGSYLLTIIWLSAFKNPVGKQFQVSFNNTRLQNITCNTSNNNYKFQKVQIILNLEIGQAQIFFQMYETIPDYSGLFLSAVYFQQMILIVPNTQDKGKKIQNVLDNQFTLITNKVPGNRVFLRALTDHMITFDRLRCYYFHRHNLTSNSMVLLSNINSLALDQGSLCQDFVNACSFSACTAYNNLYENILASIDLKNNYTDEFIYERNSNGLGFFANNLDFFFYEMPFIALSYFLLLNLFKCLFNFRVSRHIRKYAFYGLFMLLLYEGNVQQFTFFFFRECKNLFSANLSHKLANIVMVYFYFLTVFFSIGGLLFFYCHYRKHMKYFLQDSEKHNMQAVVIESLESSVYPFLFGSIHALFLDSLALQTILLGIIETGYFLTKVYALRSETPNSKIKVVLLLISSLLRMGFIASFYLYEENSYPEVIDLVHYEMVWSYIVCWLAQFLVDIIGLTIELLSTLRKLLFQKLGSKSTPKQSVKLKNNQAKGKKKIHDKEALTKKRGQPLGKAKNKMNRDISKSSKRKKQTPKPIQQLTIKEVNSMIAKKVAFRVKKYTNQIC